MEDWWSGILGVPLSSTRNPNHRDPNHQFTLSWNKIHQTYFPGSQQIPLKPNESPELHSRLGPLGFFYSNFWTFSDDDLILQMAKNVPNLMLIVCRTETHVWCDDFVLCRTFDPLKCNTVFVGWRTPVQRHVSQNRKTRSVLLPAAFDVDLAAIAAPRSPHPARTRVLGFLARYYIYINMNHNTHPSPKTSSWCHLRMPPGSGAVDVSICLRFDIIWPTAHRAQCMESTFLLHNSFPHLLQSLGYCTSKPERLAWNSLQPWENPKPLPPTWICVTLMLAKSSKHILPNGGLMVVYHGRIRKKITPKNKSKYRNCATHYCWAVGSRNSDHQQSERYHPVQTNLSPEKCRSEDEMPSLTWFFVFLGGFLSKSFRGK